MNRNAVSLVRVLHLQTLKILATLQSLFQTNAHWSWLLLPLKMEDGVSSLWLIRKKTNWPWKEVSVSYVTNIMSVQSTREQLTISPSIKLPFTGDILIHVPDPSLHHAPSMRRLIWEYLWDGSQMHGHYEGRYVLTVAPGFGMLVNGVPKNANLKFSGRCSVDDAGLSRGTVGEGAVSHHHDCKWKYDRDVGAGEELFVEYGQGWFKERGFEFDENNQVIMDMPKKRSGVEQSKREGYCLDNVVPGMSVVKGAGRGAFASRGIQDGSVIAPVPVIPLSSSSLEMVRMREDGSIFTSTQLLRNYCFGHRDSSLLLFPYSQSVNLINHDSNPNVKLQWWSGSIQQFNETFLELQQSPSIQLMLELVAIRRIEEGEELYLDYGQEWQDAWDDHVEEWIHNNKERKQDHISSEKMNNDKSYSLIRTIEEQQTDPYPKDVFTSCYVQYTPNTQKGSARTITIWKNNPEAKSSRSLRPCLILARELDASDYTYTVRAMNRPMLKEDERIPKEYEYIVTNVPRNAIIFSDKTYSSDQHLETAFRKVSVSLASTHADLENLFHILCIIHANNYRR